MKIGSLFDGIGGFPYSASKLGIEPVWASEIEAFPIMVTQHHLPNMKHLGDITKINGAEIEPVDVITFGSPCQDMSVAGKRAGLEGERSGLFSQATRIIREMRNASGGQYPRFAVWENVPGAFSSNKGLDFRAVLEEIGNAEIPMPKSGRWATAGMVRTETADIAWRVLDAQYHGVPQRRRRIFLVADFGGTSAGEILFIEQGLSWDTQESGESGQEAAGCSTTGIDEPSRCMSFSSKRRFPAVVEPIAIDHVITTGGNCTAQGPCVKENGPMFTLKAAGAHAVMAAYPEPLHTLRAKGNLSHRPDSDNLVRQGYAVRRLTPTECSRLQGFPDGWLDIEGASDTAKYKAIGNSIAVPCVDYIMSGIARVLKNEKN